MKTRRKFIKEASGLLGVLSLTPQMLFSQNQGDIMQTVRLNNDVLMPILGYGVYQINDLKECQRCVEDAFSVLIQLSRI